MNISTGQINHIIIKNKDRFHDEKDQILSTGLKVSNYINVDDTGARHNGQNGYCTHIGNEYFAWFKSTDSKSRINFLNLLRSGYTDFVLNDQAFEYMAEQKLPEYQLSKLSCHKNKIFNNETRWINFLKWKKIKTERHKRVATEGALVGSITYHGFNPELAIISDDAGQFKVFLHGLCWIHAERTVQKIIGFNDHHNQLLEEAKTDIWELYNNLKKYRQSPVDKEKKYLENRLDALFTRKTGFATLARALKRLFLNK